jgi:cobalt-zinc-cadmium efflux system membrane fusion protein
MNRSVLIVGLALLVTLVACAACDVGSTNMRRGGSEWVGDIHDHDDHGDDGAHTGDSDHADDGDHEDDDHDAGESMVVELASASERLAGVAFAEASTGALRVEISAPGEVGFNEDRLAHVSPRFEGIVQKVSRYAGSRVRSGDELARIESNASLSEYVLKAPINGTIVDKHITPGEFVSQDSQLFTIADLSTVWVNLEVPAKYAGLISKGQEIELESLGSALRATGVVDYTAPVLHESTRSGLARIELPNPGGVWLPGTFVTGRTWLTAESPAVLVNRDAVQVIAGEKVIFAPLGDGRYRALPVTTGLSNQEQTQILTGLESGSRYVCSGAFELKAQLVVSTLSGHAGHGH